MKTLSIRQLRSAHAGPIDLDLQAGECVSIMGPSGCGKSRFLRLVADLDPGDGTVLLDGLDRDGMRPAAWRSAVMYHPAEPGWWLPTAGDHLPPDSAEGLPALLEALDLPAELLERPVELLSTGQRQRLALVRSLLRRPAVMLLDEPTAALDGASTLLAEAVLRQRLQAGMAAVLVTHSPEQAQRLGDRHYRMAGGRLEPRT